MDGRAIPSTGAADDDGRADPALAAALAAYGADPSARHEDSVLEVLGSARLLVPVVARLEAPEPAADADVGGLPHDKATAMASVMMRGADGRTALLAFTGLEAMHRWDPEARPVPVAAARAAEAALADGAVALLIDAAGPVRFVALVSAPAE